MDESITLPGLELPEFKPGWVWLCGAGPGDPGLMTLLALHAVKNADVIVHDALISDAILEWANSDAEIIAAGKRGGKESALQKDISYHLIDLARAGKRVLRLKGGDPFMFGRGGEEAQTLVQNKVNFRIIPGISAGLGGLAYAGIPATHRDINQTVTFLTGHDLDGGLPDLDWPSLSRGSPVLVMYMAMRTIGPIAKALIDAGRSPDEPVGVIENASLPDQRVLETTLEKAETDIAAFRGKGPSIVCIGPAVLMRQALDWQALVRGDSLRDSDPLGRGKPAEDK